MLRGQELLLYVMQHEKFMDMRYEMRSEEEMFELIVGVANNYELKIIGLRNLQQ